MQIVDIKAKTNLIRTKFKITLANGVTKFIEIKHPITAEELATAFRVFAMKLENLK